MVTLKNACVLVCVCVHACSLNKEPDGQIMRVFFHATTSIWTKMHECECDIRIYICSRVHKMAFIISVRCSLSGVFKALCFLLQTFFSSRDGDEVQIRETETNET